MSIGLNIELRAMHKGGKKAKKSYLKQVLQRDEGQKRQEFDMPGSRSPQGMLENEGTAVHRLCGTWIARVSIEEQVAEVYGIVTLGRLS